MVLDYKESSLSLLYIKTTNTMRSFLRRHTLPSVCLVFYPPSNPRFQTWIFLSTKNKATRLKACGFVILEKIIFSLFFLLNNVPLTKTSIQARLNLQKLRLNYPFSFSCSYCRNVLPPLKNMNMLISNKPIFINLIGNVLSL